MLIYDAKHELQLSGIVQKNNEVLKTVEARRELMDTLRSRQKRWLGHVLRHGSLLRTVLKGRLPEKKERGRPKEMLLSWLLETNVEDCLLYTSDAADE